MRVRAIASAAVLVALAACSNGVDRTVPATPSASSSSLPEPEATPSTPVTGPGTTTTATPAPAPSASTTRPHAIHVRGLPEQGVAVSHAGSTDLHDLFSGKLVAHLPGFTIFHSTDQPGHLVLERSDGVFYELMEFERLLRPLASRRAAERRLGPADEPHVDLPVPESGGRRMLGYWRFAVNDTRIYDRLLAQWSGECEAPIAFFVDRDEGDPVPVTGESDPADAPESEALGYTKVGQAVVFLPHGECGSTAIEPGVALYRTPGQGRLIVPTRPDTEARMWGTAVAG